MGWIHGWITGTCILRDLSGMNAGAKAALETVIGFGRLIITYIHSRLVYLGAQLLWLFAQVETS